MENAQDVIIRYLQDAIAAERAFETQLRDFAGEADDAEGREIFSQHAEETRQQHQLLSERLASLGGTRSTGKSFLAGMFSLAPKTAQIGFARSERLTQNLIMAFSVENSEIPMYESLALTAAAGGDPETSQLARSIQKQEQETAAKVWGLIARAAERSYAAIVESARGSATISGQD
jgi:ferritin-like metal-binding protein YciE